MTTWTQKLNEKIKVTKSSRNSMNCKPVLSCSDLMKVKPENEKAKLFNCFELHHWHSTVLAPILI